MRRLVPIVALALGGCFPAVTSVGPNGEMPFPECSNVELAFSGESTLDALGLGAMAAGGPDGSRSAMIWVTANPVQVEMGMPPGMEPPPPERWVCVQWPDGSGMAGPVPAGWSPPSILDGDLAEAAAEGPPLALVALAVGAVLLVGVSFVAFRREPAA